MALAPLAWTVGEGRGEGEGLTQLLVAQVGGWQCVRGWVG